MVLSKETLESAAQALIGGSLVVPWGCGRVSTRGVGWVGHPHQQCVTTTSNAFRPLHDLANMRLAVGLQLAAAVRRTPIATARAGWAAGLHTACHPLPTPRLSTSTISLAARPTTVFRHPAAPTTAPLSLGAHPCAPCSQSLLLRRAFHSSSRRSDVFFASIPAIKSGLLTITRFSLLFLPFVFRYR